MALDKAQLIRKRGAIKHKLTNFIKFFEPIKNLFNNEDLIDEAKIIALKARTELLQISFYDFEETQLNIEYLCIDDEIDEQYKERDAFVEKYTENYSLANHIIDLSLNKKPDNRWDL